MRHADTLAQRSFWFLRHGETDWNAKGLAQGDVDTPLNPAGIAQAQAAALLMRHRGVVSIIASPLSRATKTAQAICGGRTGLTLEFDEGLLEISHGKWEGLLATDVQRDHAEMFGTWRSKPGRDVPAGPEAETLGDVEQRAWAVVEKVFMRMTPTSTALVVAHDAVNRVILCRVLGLPLERVWKFRQAPAALKVLSGASLAELTVVRLNDSDHSQPLVSTAVHAAL